MQFGAIDYNAGTTSYLVNRKSIRLICDILAESIEAGADCPLDLIYREKAAAGQLRAKCLFPFITSVPPGQFASSVEDDRTHRASLLAMNLMRHSFFVECDMQAALDLARQQLTQPDPAIHDRLHAYLFGYIASDAFERF